MNKKKKFKIIGIIALLLILVAGIIDYQDNLHPKLELKNNTLTVEYGDDVNSLLKNCIDTSIYENKDIIDEIKYSCKQIKDFDNVPVGKYTINYKYRDTEKTLKLIVQDTIAPKIALTKEINIFENDVISYDDYVEVSDLSKYKITIDDSKVNYNTAGTYVAKYTAKDKYGNINTIDIPVVVEELLLQSNSPTNITLNPNGTSKFEISTNCNSAITYSSSDPNVATVDNSGNIIAKSSGSTTITAYVKGNKFPQMLLFQIHNQLETQGLLIITIIHHSTMMIYLIQFTKLKLVIVIIVVVVVIFLEAVFQFLKITPLVKRLRACSVCNP